MAKDSSFDIVSKVDFSEVTNAITQTMKEIDTRYDFKGSKSEVSLDKKKSLFLFQMMNIKWTSLKMSCLVN